MLNTREWYKRRNNKNLKTRTKKRKAKKARKTKIIKNNILQKKMSKEQNANSVFQNGEKKVIFSVPRNITLHESEETLNFFNSILEYIANKYNYSKRKSAK